MLVPKAIYSFKAAVNLISRKLRFVISLTTILFPFCADAQDIETHQLTDGRTVAPLDMFRECDDCPEMIVIPLGSRLITRIWRLRRERWLTRRPWGTCHSGLRCVSNL